MSVSVLNFSMSLDGYIAGPNDNPGNPGGDGFDRLHKWFFTPEGEFFGPSGPAGELVDEEIAAGAVLTGRRTAEQADHWGGDIHGGPPSRLITGVVTFTAPRSSCSANVRRIPR